MMDFLLSPNKGACISDDVILVDVLDNEIGTAQKMLAHERGLLHRAFSVVIYRDITTDYGLSREFLIQRRSYKKYHSKLLWSNTCCSHPRYGEKVYDAAIRRLYEEMGASGELTFIKKILYYLKLDSNMTEHELDYIFFGPLTCSNIAPNADEVESYKWITFDDWISWYRQRPYDFTAWSNYILKTIWDTHNQIVNT